MANDIGEKWCLTAPSTPVAYLEIWPCFGGTNQMWEVWDGGWTRNVGWGTCLTANARSVWVARCAADRRQYWWSWYGGWKQRLAYSGDIARCLARVPGDAHRVYVGTCGNPNALDPPKNWYFNRVPGT